MYDNIGRFQIIENFLSCAFDIRIGFSKNNLDLDNWKRSYVGSIHKNQQRNILNDITKPTAYFQCDNFNNITFKYKFDLSLCTEHNQI